MTKERFSELAKSLAIGHFTCHVGGDEPVDYDKFMNHWYDEDVFYERQEASGIPEDEMKEWEPVMFWEPFEYWPEESVAQEVTALYDSIMSTFKGAYDE